MKVNELGGREVEIVVKSAIPVEWIIDNVNSSFQRDPPRFAKLPDLGKAEGPIAIIGGGPSLRGEIDNLKKFPGPLMSCGTCHDYLIDQGVVPTYHVIADSHPVTVNWLKKPHKDVIYLIASQCDPALFKALKDYNVRLWHAFVIREDGSDVVSFHGEPTIPGGDFVIGRAWPMATVLGHKDIHFYGFDCSFPPKCLSQHAYDYDWDTEEPCWVTVDFTGNRHLTTPGWMNQANMFVKMLTTSPDFKITIHGDGLVADICCGSKR